MRKSNKHKDLSEREDVQPCLCLLKSVDNRERNNERREGRGGMKRSRQG
jgi:hypothetical protein